MTKLKALSVIQCREYVLEQHGPEGIALVKAAMPVEARDAVYSDQLMPTDWVEVGYGVDHARGYESAFGTGDGQRAMRMLRELTSRHLTGLYKSVLAGNSAREVLERAGRLWNRYYDRGETELSWLGETRAVKRILGCPDLPRDHDWFTTAYYEVLLRQLDVKEVMVRHTRCVAKGSDCCETELRWRAGRASTFPIDL